ncbi:gastrula zinc finger protein XlCGF26.1-like [Phlebotomus papatasi]|uniref:gastrula zinc finger protein XlCGF26.1-like n=1 Tax=Phlebotomus papatasi TaxID=29031 RepID=UPI0024839003|nr:gastrula zinc finger protein XlCGF26.1-like [Phlebotomus papatasi]
MKYIAIEESCRACQINTQEESEKIFIFTTAKLPDVFKETTSLDIHENDGLPKVLCCSCYDRLLDAYNFRKMCSSAALHFQKILSMDVPEEKYTSPETTDVHLTDNIQIKTEPDSDAPNSPLRNDQNCPPDSDDTATDISDMLSIEEKPLDVIKTDPNDSDSLTFQKQEENSSRMKTRKQPIVPEKHVKFECGICNSSFHQKCRLEMHIWTKHLGLKPFKCEICGKEFKSSSSLSNHLKTHKGSEDHSDITQHVCVICGLKHETEDELKDHIYTHKKDKKWICVFCPFKTLKRYSLQHHVKVVHKGIKDFHCSRCERSFTTAASLRNHMMRHELIKNHECSICGIKTVTGSELNSHMTIHVKTKLLSCELCPLKFSRRGNLKQHINTVHQGIKNHHCTICSKSFGTTRSLKNHLMLHTGERPFACTKCPKGFIRMEQLTVHMKIHTGQDMFFCEFCPFKTFHQIQIKRHTKAVHEGVKDHHCPHCKRSFAAATALKNHLLTHTGEKPHNCSECGMRFAQRSNLMRHLKTHLKSKSTARAEDTPTIKLEENHGSTSGPSRNPNTVPAL